MRKGGNCGYKGVLAFLIVVASFLVLILNSVGSGVIGVSGNRSAELSSPRSNQLVAPSPDSCEASTTSTFTVVSKDLPIT